MWFLFLLLFVSVPGLLFFLAKEGKKLRARAAELPPACASWPSAGLVIPCCGTHPDMERALRSLLEQQYAGEVRCCLVTATDDEPAAVLVRKLAAEYAHVAHVTAGRAELCGQKNHNSLAAVRELGDSVDVYAFCDSTHMASPDFLSRLIAPIAQGKGVFSTGYHEVVPRDKEPVTLAYAFCVLCMRILQGLAKFTQPWGGAMAVERRAFHELGIGKFWADNVVDDCSLTTFLQERSVSVCLCPGALLRTNAEHHKFSVWTAWLERQILFLKFCVPLQWILLGLVIVLMALVPASALVFFIGGLCGLLKAGWLVLACICLTATGIALSCLRPLMAHHIPLVRLMCAFFLMLGMAFVTFLKTIPASGILWHGIWYTVGRAGKVTSIVRK